jgi:hypothetical protein
MSHNPPRGTQGIQGGWHSGIEFAQIAKNWVNGDSDCGINPSRKIEIRSHVSGIRITLIEDYNEISFSTGEPLHALKDALKHFELSKTRILKEKIERKIEDLEKKEREIQEEKKEVDRLKKILKDRALSTFEDQ